MLIYLQQSYNRMSSIRHPKVILLGDASVGKTALLQTFVNGEFPTKVISTMGACFQRHACRSADGKEISIDIWDTAGQEKYRSLLTLYYKNSDVILMVFDLSRPETFDTVGFWASQIQNNCEKKPCVILVGNKYDLRKQCKLIPDEKIKIYAKTKGWMLYYSSALENYNVKEIFLKAAELGLANLLKNEKKQSPMKVNVKNKKEQRQGRSCC